ncbi:MAG: Uma2 family endonuclease [Geitlerinemataceae cyanobacterium]
MIAQPDRTYLTPEEYLAAEAVSPVKHEYHDGEIFAMAGASNAHVIVTDNLTGLLLAHTRGTGCRPYSTDMKVRIESTNRFFYPDLLVTCDRADREADLKQRPKLIIEVLSDSTEAFDRGKKFDHYSELESLEEYVLVSQDRIRVEIFQRRDDDTWTLKRYGAGETVRFASLDFDCPIAEIYTDVALPS